MDLSPYLVMIATLSLAILSPGPAIIAATQTAFAQGRERALPYGIGLATGASLWCLFALAGLAVVFRLHPALFTGMKVLGGVYLIWMSWGLWRAATLPLPEAADGRFGRSFWGGIVLNLSNPKPALFYSALILSVFPDPLSVGRQLGIYAACLTTELFWYVVVVLAMSTTVMRNRYFAARLWIDRAAAVALFGLGLMLIFKS